MYNIYIYIYTYFCEFNIWNFVIRLMKFVSRNIVIMIIFLLNYYLLTEYHGYKTVQ